MALYLVDGHALAYRSYFAFAGRPLVSSKGEETSAVYGFTNTMLALLERFRPSFVAVAFDAVERTFRHDIYEAYKANREEMPDTLKYQLPVIFAVLDAMRIPYLLSPGFEADDIIATLTRRWRERLPVGIVSGDKDLFQLIDARVRVIRPGRGGVLEAELDEAGLKRLTGLEPRQIPDFLALVGDSSDNVPGVRGIGQKTARALLDEHGSLDGIYAALDAVGSASVRRKLEAGRESAYLSRRLVELRDDVPVTLELDALAAQDFRTEAFAAMLSELEFHRMRRQVFDEPRGVEERAEAPPPAAAPTPEPPRAADEPSYRAVVSETELARLCEALSRAPEIAVDVETSGLDPMRAVLAGVSLCAEPGRAWYVPVASDVESGEPGLFAAPRAPGLALDTVRRHLAPVLAAERPAKVGQNIKFDEIVLERAGMPLGGIAFDTMIASYCLDPARRSHGLDALALDFCAHRMIPFESLFPKRSGTKDIRTVPLERVTTYAAEDADYTLRVRHGLAPLLAASRVRDLFETVEMPLRGLLARMEMTGVHVDVAFLEELSRVYGARIAALEERIYNAVGERFNVNSTPKLREILFDRLGLAPARRTKTGYSTDVDVLSGLAGTHPVIPLLLEYRQLVKLKSTYVDALPRLVHPATGRVHTSYNQAVATTGRLSSSDPNLQNIPIRTAEGREIRKAFAAGGENWTLLDADYSQIELRILAHLSGDRELIQAFRDDADVHRRTAARILGVAPEAVSGDMRSRAKTVNFGIIYGMGARGLAQALDIDVDEARRFIAEYFRSYPGVKRFIDDTIARARQDKSIDTLLGRARRLPDIDSTNARARAFSERVAVNTPVQGTAADIIKLAMLAVDRRLRGRTLGARMILQVHDELLFEVPLAELEETTALVRTCMEEAIALDVPLKVDMGAGPNWYEAH
jgi:DNA polymerase-1